MFETKKHRMTKQRQVILDELRKLDTHPNADEIYQIVKKKIPNISLGTNITNFCFFIRVVRAIRRIRVPRTASFGLSATQVGLGLQSSIFDLQSSPFFRYSLAHASNRPSRMAWRMSRASCSRVCRLWMESRVLASISWAMIRWRR